MGWEKQHLQIILRWTGEGFTCQVFWRTEGWCGFGFFHKYRLPINPWKCDWFFLFWVEVNYIGPKNVPASNLPYMLPEGALTHSVFPLETLKWSSPIAAGEHKLSALCCCSESWLLSEEVAFLLPLTSQTILLNRRWVSTYILQSYRVTALPQSWTAISNLVFSFPLFLSVTVPRDCSNRTALAALPGPPKSSSVCRERSCEMVQEGPACSFPPGHCCKWELEGENGDLVLPQILSPFKETQQQLRFCSVWVWSCSMWHKWNTLVIRD